MHWEDKAFIKSSKNRVQILNTLKAEPLTVTELAKKLDNHRSTVSQQLLRLEKAGFVKCLTPARANYHIYGITKKGKGFVKQG